MKEKYLKLTESELKNVIKNSVKRIVEGFDDYPEDYDDFDEIDDWEDGPGGFTEGDIMRSDDERDWDRDSMMDPGDEMTVYDEYPTDDITEIYRIGQNRRLNEERQAKPLSDQAILALAKVVVSEYGNGNCIDLNNPQGVIETVRYVQRTEGCDEYKALLYMSGALGGGWG